VTTAPGGGRRYGRHGGAEFFDKWRTITRFEAELGDPSSGYPAEIITQMLNEIAGCQRGVDRRAAARRWRLNAVTGGKKKARWLPGLFYVIGYGEKCRTRAASKESNMKRLILTGALLLASSAANACGNIGQPPCIRPTPTTTVRNTATTVTTPNEPTSTNTTAVTTPGPRPMTTCTVIGNVVRCK
jgi:hypothetical protein